MLTTQTAPNEDVRAVLMLARRGDLPAARKAGERALAEGASPALFWPLLGALCCEIGDLDAAVGYLRLARDIHPEDVTIALNLASALHRKDDARGALEVCTPPLAAADPSSRVLRLRAYLLQSLEKFAEAGDAYERVVAKAPLDFESWNNLGNVRVAKGDVAGGLDALRRAAELRPDSAPVRMNLATSLIEAGKGDEAEAALRACARDFPRDIKPLVELAGLLRTLDRSGEAVTVLEDAVRRASDDPDLHVKLGAERIQIWDMAGGEVALSRAIALAPAHAEAHLHRAFLLEHTHRGEQISAKADEAMRVGVDPVATTLIRALGLRREQRWPECLAALAGLPEDFEPIRVSHMRGQCHDRLGEAAAAFDAFAQMNRLVSEDPSGPLRRAADSRAALKTDLERVTPAWRDTWRRDAATPPERTPVFLVGFPRSGTTLLDTILMGHPDVDVMEEKPALNHVATALGGIEQLAQLSDDELAALRRRYFEGVSEAIVLRPGALLVDKSPLHMTNLPLIRRLFPEARVILALRHPCDVVLSCYTTNFRPNPSMANFLNLETSAEFYDLCFHYFEQCRAVFAPPVREVAYERMVANPAAELRPLFDFLGLDWRPEVLQHQQTARARGVISTASYAQVTEPLYTRSAGRWARYRAQLEPVLPVLAPWCERYGYAL